MHVIDANTVIKQMVGQILRHTLCQRGDQHALMTCHSFTNFIDQVIDLPTHRLIDQVIDLPTHRAHVDLGVEQARRANDLLHVVLAHSQLIVARCGAHIDELRNARHKFVIAQGAIVERRGQAEPVLDKRHLTRAVSLVHAADLRHRDMALVDERRGQAEPVLDKRHLTRAVSLVHAADLRHRDMALVDDAQHVLGEIIYKRERGLARFATIQMS